MSLSPEDDKKIAIIGIAGRFPGAANIAEFWDNLRNGTESITTFSDAELRAAGIPAAVLRDKKYVKRGTVLPGIECFDSGFFSLAEREADLVDPQQRIFWECVVEALDDAGYLRERSDCRTGIFAGSSPSTYVTRLIDYLDPANSLAKLTGNDSHYLATQLSYRLGLTGPSFGVQTACSTSLVAASLACSSLQNFECDLAVAGGVTIRVPQVHGYLYEDGIVASPDGVCRALDKDANGTVFGNGAGAVILKRLSDALQDGDRIYAVILGAAVNNDGNDKVGYVAPSPTGQAKVIAEAQYMAGVDPDTISYIEAHGTGTPLGDPVELSALMSVFSAKTKRKQFCALGSVKTNVGHLEVAAGVCGLIKTVLALYHKEIPPSLHCSEPTPEFDFAGSPFYVANKLVDWNVPSGPRRAGVSSFGIGGTNAHLVLEEASGDSRGSGTKARSVALPVARNVPVLLALSARSPNALARTAAAYRSFLDDSGKHVPLTDIAFSALTRRARHEYRHAFVGRTHEELSAKLSTFIANDAAAQSPRIGRDDRFNKKVVFLYSGQGSHWPRMGFRLFESNSIFRDTIEACEVQFRRYGTWSLIDELRKGETAAEWRTEVDKVQPMLFALQLGLTRVLASFGIAPTLVIGHSLGEVSAACAAEKLSLEAGARIICERSKAIRQFRGRLAMLLVDAEPAAVEGHLAALAGRVEIAAINGPGTLLIGGEREAILALKEDFTAEQIFCALVSDEYSSHCAQMEDALPALRAALGTIRPAAGKIAMYSTVTGDVVGSNELDESYWCRNLRAPVRFHTVVKKLLAENEDVVFMEISGHPVLRLAVEATAAGEEKNAPFVATLRRNEDEEVALLAAAGELYRYGFEPGLEIAAGGEGKFVDLPLYQWDRRRHWIEPDSAAFSGGQAPLHLGVEWEELPAGELPGAKRGQTRTRIVIGDDDDSYREDTVRAFCDGGEYVITVANTDEVARYLEAAKAEGRCGRDAELLFTFIAPPRAVGEDAVELEKTQELLCGAVLAIVQLLFAADLRCSVTIDIVTRGVYPIAGEAGPTNLAHWPLWGMGRTMINELVDCRCRLIDVDTAPERFSAAALVLLLESAPGTESQLALRGERRFAGRLRETVLRPSHSTLPVTSDATYVVTGGLGGIGLETARWLVSQGARNIVLVGRSAPGKEPAEKIALLEAAGANVRVVQCDVGKKDDVHRLFSALEKSGPPVRGIIHAAGLHNEALLSNQTWDRFRDVMSSKIAGGWNVHSSSLECPLDFFILCSSSVALIGAPGLAFYAAANSFLDGLALYRRERQLPALSINWGTWDEVGMGTKIAGHNERLASKGFLPMSPDEAFPELEALLRADIPNGQAAVLKLDRQELVKSYPEALSQPYFTDLLPRASAASESGFNTAQTSARAKLEGLDSDGRRKFLESHLVGLVAQTLNRKPAEIKVDRPLRELGVDSLMALELRNRILTSLGVKLSPAVIWTRPTVAALVPDIATGLGLAFDATSVNAAPGPVTHAGAAKEPIAIVGMACRYPGGADTPDKLWSILIDGRDAITDVPPGRFEILSHYDPKPNQPGKSHTKSGGFIRDVELFEPSFFGMSDTEARTIDPQQKVALEVTWEALEDAGIPGEKIGGSDTGIFLGVRGITDYYRVLPTELRLADEFTIAGASPNVIAARIAYYFDTHGPSYIIDTGCSSAAVAIHQAAKALQHGDCSLALAGGVNTIHTHELLVLASHHGWLSTDGRCRSFDAKASGFGRADGCGMFVLKRLSDAVSAGDRVYGVLRGSAVNHNGRTYQLMNPNVFAEQMVMENALRDAARSAEDVVYVEANGNGLPLADAIELEAMKKVYAKARLEIGSVKTNIGHSESASGTASLMKVLLAFRHGTIPPNLHFSSLNPHATLDGVDFHIPTEPVTLNTAETPALAAVSCFGMSGTNVHLLVESPGETLGAAEDTADGRYFLLPLSAKTVKSLRASVEAHREFLHASAGRYTLHDICYSASVRRSHHEHRAVFIGRTVEELSARMSEFLDERPGREEANTSTVVDVGNRLELERFGRIYLSGAAVEWPKFYPKGGKYVGLPLYQWNKALFRLDDALAPRIEKLKGEK